MVNSFLVYTHKLLIVGNKTKIEISQTTLEKKKLKKIFGKKKNTCFLYALFIKRRRLTRAKCEKFERMGNLCLSFGGNLIRAES